MAITTDDIKALRGETGVSVMQIKKALEEAGGDRAKALVLLQKKGAMIAEKKADRTLGAGAVSAYIHSTKMIGSMVMLSCETDFVAKNEEFLKLAYAVAMQVAATNPDYLSRADIPAGALAEADRILLEQSFIKDEGKTVKDLIDAAVQKFGERIEIGRFIRFSTR